MKDSSKEKDLVVGDSATKQNQEGVNLDCLV